jgi:hypothetical protein
MGAQILTNNTISIRHWKEAVFYCRIFKLALMLQYYRSIKQHIALFIFDMLYTWAITPYVHVMFHVLEWKIINTAWQYRRTQTTNQNYMWNIKSHIIIWRIIFHGSIAIIFNNSYLQHHIHDPPSRVSKWCANIHYMTDVYYHVILHTCIHDTCEYDTMIAPLSA